MTCLAHEKTFPTLEEMQAFEREIWEKSPGWLISDSHADPKTKTYSLRWQIVAEEARKGKA